MLTADLILPRLYENGADLSIQMVRENDPRHLKTAQDLIHLFELHLNKPRYFWENSLEQAIGERLDYLFMRGLAKVLTDSATFAPLDFGIASADLRAFLFQRAPVSLQIDLFQPHSRADLLQLAAKNWHTETAKIEQALFADLPDQHVLRDIGREWTPTALLNRYNLELARGVLYWARGMKVQIQDNYKDFWKYLKLFKLMFWASPLPTGGYEIQIEGAISPFVQSTTRYGRQLAAFLPALFLGEAWQMQAEVKSPKSGHWLNYSLDHTQALITHFKASGEFDSRLEADFAADFAQKLGDEREQWQLTREDEVLLLGDTVMIPDFGFTHKKDGRRALLEIMGFWHPDYVQRKLEKVRQAKREDLILLIYEGVNLTENALDDVPNQVLYFKNKPIIKEVMLAVERVAR